MVVGGPPGIPLSTCILRIFRQTNVDGCQWALIANSSLRYFDVSNRGFDGYVGCKPGIGFDINNRFYAIHGDRTTANPRFAVVDGTTDNRRCSNAWFRSRW